MKIERLILIPFFGNYLINNIAAAIAATIAAPQTPTEGIIDSLIHSRQYDAFVILAAIAVMLFMWWFLRSMSGDMLVKKSVVFGIVAASVLIAAVFIYGIATSSPGLSMQHILVLAAIAVALLAWRFFFSMVGGMSTQWGVVFGIVAFQVSIITTFISGIAGVALQTNSFAQAMGVIPRFGPFLWNWSTLVVLGYWIIPAVLIAWFLGRKAAPSSASTM